MHEGKRAAESLCFDYPRMFSLRIHSARIFDVYCPRMDLRNHHVVSEFIYKYLIIMLSQSIVMVGKSGVFII